MSPLRIFKDTHNSESLEIILFIMSVLDNVAISKKDLGFNRIYEEKGSRPYIW